uniref:K Homology domain-containing protein n=1 Tax=Laticauda laticaudata TaxID=8630 RepID=A0A8C5SM25_LATLA
MTNNRRINKSSIVNYASKSSKMTQRPTDHMSSFYIPIPNKGDIMERMQTLLTVYLNFTCWQNIKIRIINLVYSLGDGSDEPCDAFAVEETERGYQCAMDIPSPLYKYIIGKKGETRKKLETETRTSISIPKPGVEGEIVITGQHRSGVISARTRIDVLVESFRKKQPFSHFLSFALNQPAIQERFLQFKEEVLEKCSHVSFHYNIWKKWSGQNVTELSFQD